MILTKFTTGHAAGLEFHDGTEYGRMTIGGGKPDTREVLRRRRIFEKSQALDTEQRQVEVAIPVDVDRGDRAPVVVGVQPEDIGALNEALERPVRVVEEPVALVPAERSPEVGHLARQDILKGPILFQSLGIGDHLSPEERSVVGSLSVCEARVAVRDEDLFVAVVVEVVEEAAPCPSPVVYAQRLCQFL